MIDWESILRHDGPAIWRTAWRVLATERTPTSVSGTFVAALDYAKRPDHAVQNWRALLQRIATGRAIDRLRRRVSQRTRKPHPNRSSEFIPHAS